MIDVPDLEQYGIKAAKEIIYQPTYNILFAEETRPGLTGFEKGVITKIGAVAVNTGIFTGRSPNDKYIVYDDKTKDTVWWKSEKSKIADNKPATREIWEHCKS